MINTKLNPNELDNFYQSKFDYYKIVSGYCAILIGILEMTYFISDCQLYGRFAWETFIPRMSMILPLLFFMFFYPRVKNYKVGALLYYLIPHAAMWCTIWSFYNLDNRDFVREGFIIMHFAFLAIGLAMPIKYHAIFHGLLIFNIVISNTFMHYEYFSLIISLALPVYFGVLVMLFILENSYTDQYLIKRKLEINSVSDELTNVYNRYKLKDIVNSKTEAFTIKGNVFIAMLDIDFFKKVNDTYGHEAGDEILKFMANEIKRHLSSRDYVIRWGGEEFVIILANYTPESAISLAEALREDIKSKDNGVCPITVSVGLYKYQRNETYHSAIAKADQALYYAKEHGRDQVANYANIN